MRMAYFMQSARIGFRHWFEDDLPLAMWLWGDPRVTEFIDIRDRLSEEEVAARLNNEIAMQKCSGVQYWPIFLKEEDIFVGCCGLRPYKPEEKILEIGSHILYEYWRRGFAEEAVRRVMKYAFEKLKINALFAGHNPGNDASREFLAKLGFRYTRDEYYEPTGLMHPSYLFRREDYHEAE